MQTESDNFFFQMFISGLEGDQRTGSVPDISSLGPGAYSLGPSESSGTANVPAYMERMTTDISALKKQYAKLRQRQAQAHIILNCKLRLALAKVSETHFLNSLPHNPDF